MVQASATGSDGGRPSEDVARGDEIDQHPALWPPNVGDDELGDVRALLEILHPVVFEAGQLIFAEGDPGDTAYVIQSGIAKIKRRGPGGRDIVIAIAGPGDIVGELSVFDPGPRIDTVVAASDVRTGSLDRRVLRRCVAEQPAILPELLQLLARQLKRRHDQFAAMVTTDIAGRLARQLLYLAERFGTDQGSQTHVSVGVTDDEFADLLGTSSHTLNKTLRDFVNRGWVRREPDGALILDRRALERLANQSPRPIEPIADPATPHGPV